MTAPDRKPYYWDHGTSEEGYDPADAVRWTVDDFYWATRSTPDWRVEDTNVEIVVSLIRHDPGELVVLGWQAAGLSGRIEARPDPSGWVRVIGTLAETEVFAAYLHRQWEQWELWPEDAHIPAHDSEGPGTIGKHQNWVNIDTAAWPALAPLAPERYVTFSINEEKLRQKDRP
jgi:hypothetical protein